MIIEKLSRWHMQMLEQQGVPEVRTTWPYLESLIAQPSWAGIAEEGVVGAMGFAHMNARNYRCWAITDPALLPKNLTVVSRHMIRQMNAMVAEGIANRIETVVQKDNAAALRWMRILGFTRPHLMTNFNEYGDAWLLERVQRG